MAWIYVEIHKASHRIFEWTNHLSESVWITRQEWENQGGE